MHRHFLVSIILILLNFVGLTSCTNRTPETSKIQIQFDQNSFGTNPPRSQFEVQAANEGPTWGLPDPVSVGDIHCYGVLVHGSEVSMQTAQCRNQKDVAIKFGPRVGFFPLTQSSEIEVLSGDDRTIYLVGMSSIDSTCPSHFESNPDLDSSKFSNPFIIGQVTVDLVAGENKVQIPVSGIFNDNNKIKDCDFFEVDSPKDLIVNPHVTKRTYWLDDEVNSRTINFTHNAEFVECSRDGGNSFSACDSSTQLIWKALDIASEHIIKATYSDGSHKTYSITPSLYYPNLQIIPVASCDAVVTSGTYSFANIHALTNVTGTAADPNIVCFDDGVYASGIGSGASVGNYTIMIVRDGDLAKIESMGGSGYALLISSTQSVIVGMTFEGDPSVGQVVRIQGSGDSRFENIEVISTSSSSASGILLSPGATLNLVHSKVRSTGSSSGSALHVESASMAIVEHTFLSSRGKGVFVRSGSTATISKSQIKARGSVAMAFEIAHNSTLNLSNSEILSSSDTSSKLCPGSANTGVLSINSNLFKRLDENFVSSQAALSVNGCLGTKNIESDGNNIFCNENQQGAIFSQILDGTADNGYNPVAENSGGLISQCL